MRDPRGRIGCGEGEGLTFEASEAVGLRIVGEMVLAQFALRLVLPVQHGMKRRVHSCIHDDLQNFLRI